MEAKRKKLNYGKDVSDKAGRKDAKLADKQLKSIGKQFKVADRYASLNK